MHLGSDSDGQAPVQNSVDARERGYTISSWWPSAGVSYGSSVGGFAGAMF